MPCTVALVLAVAEGPASASVTTGAPTATHATSGARQAASAGDASANVLSVELLAASVRAESAPDGAVRFTALARDGVGAIAPKDGNTSVRDVPVSVDAGNLTASGLATTATATRVTSGSDATAALSRFALTALGAPVLSVERVEVRVSCPPDGSVEPTVDVDVSDVRVAGVPADHGAGSVTVESGLQVGVDLRKTARADDGGVLAAVEARLSATGADDVSVDLGTVHLATATCVPAAARADTAAPDLTVPDPPVPLTAAPGPTTPDAADPPGATPGVVGTSGATPESAGSVGGPPDGAGRTGASPDAAVAGSGALVGAAPTAGTPASALPNPATPASALPNPATPAQGPAAAAGRGPAAGPAPGPAAARVHGRAAAAQKRAGPAAAAQKPAAPAAAPQKPAAADPLLIAPARPPVSVLPKRLTARPAPLSFDRPPASGLRPPRLAADGALATRASAAADPMTPGVTPTRVPTDGGPTLPANGSTPQATAATSVVSLRNAPAATSPVNLGVTVIGALLLSAGFAARRALRRGPAR